MFCPRVGVIQAKSVAPQTLFMLAKYSIMIYALLETRCVCAITSANGSATYLQQRCVEASFYDGGMLGCALVVFICVVIYPFCFAVDAPSPLRPERTHGLVPFSAAARRGRDAQDHGAVDSSALRLCRGTSCGESHRGTDIGGFEPEQMAHVMCRDGPSPTAAGLGHSFWPNNSAIACVHSVGCFCRHPYFLGVCLVFLSPLRQSVVRCVACLDSQIEGALSIWRCYRMCACLL